MSPGPAGVAVDAELERDRQVASSMPGQHAAPRTPCTSGKTPNPPPQSLGDGPLGAERARELAPRADAELAVGVGEVDLDRLRGDEERLRDVAVGRRPPAARSATRRSLAVSAPTPLSGVGARAARRRRRARRATCSASAARAARVGELERAAQRLAGVAGPARAAQRGAERGERLGELEPRGRALEHRDRLLERGRGRSLALERAEHAQRAADASRGAPRPRELELLVGERERLVARGRARSSASASSERQRRGGGVAVAPGSAARTPRAAASASSQRPSATSSSQPRRAARSARRRSASPRSRGALERRARAGEVAALEQRRRRGSAATYERRRSAEAPHARTRRSPLRRRLLGARRGRRAQYSAKPATGAAPMTPNSEPRRCASARARPERRRAPRRGRRAPAR